MKTNFKINMFFFFTMGLGIIEARAQYLDQNTTEELEKFKHLTRSQNKTKAQREAEAKEREERQRWIDELRQSRLKEEAKRQEEELAARLAEEARKKQLDEKTRAREEGLLKYKENIDKMRLTVNNSEFFSNASKAKLVDEILYPYSEEQKIQLGALIESGNSSAFLTTVTSNALERSMSLGPTSEMSIRNHVDIMKEWAKFDPNAGAALFRELIQTNQGRSKHKIDMQSYKLSNMGPYQLEKILSSGINPNVKLSPNERDTLLSWLKDNLNDDRNNRLQMMKILLEHGAFEKSIIDPVSKTITDRNEFETLLKYTSLSSKNLTAHNDCQNKNISVYLRVNSPGKAIPSFPKNIAEKIDFEYKNHISTFSTVEECEIRHAKLQKALDLNRTHQIAIELISADDWNSESEDTTEAQAKTSTTSAKH